MSLVNESFEGFYPAFPLFNKARFMTILDSLDEAVLDPGRWACLNVVLALAPQFQQADPQNWEEDHEGLGYFQNAFAVAGQLMTMHVTLWSVQALLGLALVIQGMPNQGPVSLLVSAAIKLAHRMGLHRQRRDENIDAAEVEERKRVFWIAYALDKDLSLQMGLPSTQDDDDMDVDFPSEFELENRSICPGDFPSINFFGFRARLAVIQGQIYRRLYSVRATKQGSVERVVVARELQTMLHGWRVSVPAEVIGDGNASFLPISPSDIHDHPIILQLSYFNSLSMIYDALPTLPRYFELPAVGKPIELQLLSTPPASSSEARKAIKLIQVTPKRKLACVW